MDLRDVGCKVGGVDGTASGSCAVVSFGIISVETAGSPTRDF
jgi:hypothetical protein